nr:clostripain-related cysteine peptidase [Candidatus Freyarchaeota archaeon]
MSKSKMLALLLVATILIMAAVPLTVIIAGSNRTSANALMLQSTLTSQLAQVGTIPKDGNTSNDAGNTQATATPITPGTYPDNTINWSSDPYDYYNVSVPETGYTIYASIDCQLTNGTYPGGLVLQLFNPDGYFVAQYWEPCTYIRRGLVYTLNSTDQTGYWTIGVYAPTTYLIWEEVEYEFYSIGSYTLRVNVSASQSITKPEAQWTYMSYMVAEDYDGVLGMGPFSMNDIAEMAGVGSTGSVNIVVLVDPYAGAIYPELIPAYTNQSGTRIYYIDHEGVVWLSDFGDAEKNTGNYTTLRDFINYVKEHFPAQHYALNLWDHGKGIEGVCFDSTDGSDNLNFTEIFQALNETGGVNLLHYKACLSGVIEGLYSVASLTDVIVASEETQTDPSSLGSMDFYPFIDNLTSNPSAPAAQLGRWIVQAYGSCDPPFLSFAVVNSPEIANVYAALNETAKYLDIQTLNSTWRTTILQTLNQVENFSYNASSLVDLYDFADKLAQNLNDPQLTTLTNNLKTAIQNAVIYVAHGNDHPNAHGITIYHPNTEGNYLKDYYTSLLFAEDNMWDEYLWHLLDHYTEHDALDYDSDGLNNSQEYSQGTNAFNPDTDGDGLTDGQEVNIYGTNPLNSDTDSDGMPDRWEVANGLNPLVDDSSGDPDSDALTNLQEYQLGTNPQNSDTDNDGLTDGQEVNTYGTNPTNSDSDGDGLTDGQEVNTYGTNPLNSDTDSDGMPDGWEVRYDLVPLSNDANQDKDGDGFTNLQEYLAGTDPTDPNSYPLTFNLLGIIMIVILSLSAQQQSQGRNIAIISIGAVAAAVVGVAVVLKIKKVF